MAIDFGSIKRYDQDRGFGFVTKTFGKSGTRPDEVFFHITIIRQKSTPLAQQLDRGNHFGISFWYETEPTKKGEQVSNIWLEPTDIPIPYRGDIISQLQKYWFEIRLDPPIWLDDITTKFVGEERRDELVFQRNELILQRDRDKLEQMAKEAESQRQAAEDENEREQLETERRRAEQEIERFLAEHSRRQNIQRICKEREIESLIHFTRIQNLNSILQNGLLSRTSLGEQGPALFNDKLRLDGHRDAICLSISFPNWQMFYSYRKSNYEKKDDVTNWVVLRISPSVLWELDCAFCQENAASYAVCETPIEKRKEVASFEQIFADYNRLNRSELSIPLNYPTHPQAEVLVFDHIPLRYIEAVHFNSRAAYDLWIDKHINRTYHQFFFDKQYFAPRGDWQEFKRWLQNEEERYYNDRDPSLCDNDPYEDYI